MTPRIMQSSMRKTPSGEAARTESRRHAEDELCRLFDAGMEEVRAGRGVVKTLEELKAIEARIAAEP